MKLKVLFLTFFLLIMCAWMRAQSLDTMAIDYTSHVDYTSSETTFFFSCVPPTMHGIGLSSDSIVRDWAASR